MELVIASDAVPLGNLRPNFVLKEADSNGIAQRDNGICDSACLASLKT